MIWRGIYHQLLLISIKFKIKSTFTGAFLGAMGLGVYNDLDLIFSALKLILKFGFQISTVLRVIEAMRRRNVLWNWQALVLS